MDIPSFVGPLASVLLFLLTVFGFCFYYCYWKPRRQRSQAEASRSTVSNTGSPSLTVQRSCPTRKTKSYGYEEELNYGSALSPYSAGFCFHGGFPIYTSTATCYQQNTQLAKKYNAPAVTKVVRTGSRPCPKAKPCELRVELLKERLHGAGQKPFVVRQLSSDSQSSIRNCCHLQVIQECDCEEEKEENEEIAEITDKGRNDCDTC